MNRSHDRSVNVTDGQLFRPLVVLSTPIVLTMLLQVGYNLADTFWIGRIGADAVAALSYAWAIVFMMVSIGGGLTVAGTVLVAQYKGADNLEGSHHVAGQTIAFVTIVSAAFALLGFVAAPTLLTLVGAEPGSAAFGYALEYTRVLFLGMGFLFWFFIFNALMRGWGDTRTPLYLMTGSVLLNVVLDPIFILGFENNPLFTATGLRWLQTDLYAVTAFSGWDVLGAAIATVLTRGIAAVVGLYILFTGRAGLSPSLNDLWLRGETVRRILDVGLPTAGEQGFRSLGVAALTAIVAIAGTDAVAAYGIVSRLASLVFLPALGLARGTETVVGQNLGADQVDRAGRAVFLSCVLVGTTFAVVGVLARFYAVPITALFITGEGSADVIALGAAYLVICGPVFAFLGVYQIVLGGFRGSGSTRIAMLLSTQELWLFRIPLAYVLLAHFGMGVAGVWYAMAFSYIASSVFTSAWFLRGTWTDRVVGDSSPVTSGD